MDGADKLKENRNQFERGKINKDEYNKRKDAILNEWLTESK